MRVRVRVCVCVLEHYSEWWCNAGVKTCRCFIRCVTLQQTLKITIGKSEPIVGSRKTQFQYSQTNRKNSRRNTLLTFFTLEKHHNAFLSRGGCYHFNTGNMRANNMILIITEMKVRVAVIAFLFYLPVCGGSVPFSPHRICTESVIIKLAIIKPSMSLPPALFTSSFNILFLLSHSSSQIPISL